MPWWRLLAIGKAFQSFLGDNPYSDRTMNIQPHSKPVSIRNKGQISRRGKYRSELKISEQDRKDQLAIDWNPDQVPSKLIDKSDSKYTVSNFRWGWNEVGTESEWTPRHAETTIDTSKVKNVYLALEPFKPEVVAGHGLVVFEMDEDGAVESKDGQKDFGLAFSVEARKPVGEEYGLIAGMKKKFGMIFQLGSLSDQVQKTSRKRGSKLVLHRLDLDKEQMETMLNNGLDAATEDRVGEWYHTLTNSCFTEGIDLINGVVPSNQKMARWTQHLKFARPATFLPALAGATVRQKGLLAKEPISYLQPNPERYPDRQTEVKGVKKAVGVMSRSPLWRPTFRLAGLAVGGGLGYAVGSSFFGQVGTVLSSVAGVAAGTYAGDRVSDIIAVNTDRTPQNAQQWYASRGGISEAEAERRISNNPS